MDLDEKKLQEAETLLNQIGYTLPELLMSRKNRNSKLLMLDDGSYDKFQILYNQLKYNPLSTQDKGKKLEELSFLLFKHSANGLFDVFHNCRTSTNEIDLLVRWTENARLSGINTAFPCFGESFLCECKNYNAPVNVTYVGKFYSLMVTTNTDLGIMISWDGVTGRGPWNDSKGLIKKIALKDRKYIIVIKKEDLFQIYEKKASIFSIVYDKYIALKNEIDYVKYIQPHPAEQFLK